MDFENGDYITCTCKACKKLAQKFIYQILVHDHDKEYTLNPIGDDNPDTIQVIQNGDLRNYAKLSEPEIIIARMKGRIK